MPVPSLYTPDLDVIIQVADVSGPCFPVPSALRKCVDGAKQKSSIQLLRATVNNGNPNINKFNFLRNWAWEHDF